jgi:ethanolamine ammonia-lyase small subunit
MSAPDRFAGLRAYTAARIGLGRSGPGIATADHLAFRAAHALARDAVNASLDLDAMEAALSPLGAAVLRVESRAPDQATYLTRPDLGRRLADPSVALLREHGAGEEIAVLVAGGLSARAVASHAAPLIALLVPELRRAGRSVGPVCIAPRGRVALGDEVGALLGARLAIVLIGERPGLTSPDSLGAYVTIGPRVGRTDADRNCVSNIRPEGMALPEAARRIGWLIDQAMARGISGVTLKDDSDRSLVAGPAEVRGLPAGAEQRAGAEQSR